MSKLATSLARRLVQDSFVRVTGAVTAPNIFPGISMPSLVRLPGGNVTVFRGASIDDQNRAWVQIHARAVPHLCSRRTDDALCIAFTDPDHRLAVTPAPLLIPFSRIWAAGLHRRLTSAGDMNIHLVFRRGLYGAPDITLLGRPSQNVTRFLMGTAPDSFLITLQRCLRGGAVPALPSTHAFWLSVGVAYLQRKGYRVCVSQRDKTAVLPEVVAPAVGTLPSYGLPKRVRKVARLKDVDVVGCSPRSGQLVEVIEIEMDKSMPQTLERCQAVFEFCRTHHLAVPTFRIVGDAAARRFFKRQIREPWCQRNGFAAACVFQLFDDLLRETARKVWE